VRVSTSAIGHECCIPFSGARLAPLLQLRWTSAADLVATFELVRKALFVPAELPYCRPFDRNHDNRSA
jgi:hypothetical protein